MRGVWGKGRGARDTDCGGREGRKVCETDSGRGGKKQGKRETGVRGCLQPRNTSGATGGEVPSRAAGPPGAQVNHPPFPLLDVKSPFHPATLLNCCKKIICEIGLQTGKNGRAHSDRHPLFSPPPAPREPTGSQPGKPRVGSASPGL